MIYMLQWKNCSCSEFFSFHVCNLEAYMLIRNFLYKKNYCHVLSYLRGCLVGKKFKKEESVITDNAYLIF